MATQVRLTPVFWATCGQIQGVKIFLVCLTLDCVNRLAMVLLMLVTSISSYPSSDTPTVGGGAGTAGVGAGATGAAAAAFGTSGGGTGRK